LANYTSMGSPLHLLKLPLELRYHLFSTIIYATHVIRIGQGLPENQKCEEEWGKRVQKSCQLEEHLVDLNPESGGPFEALSLTCSQLREEISEWFQVEQNVCKDLYLTKDFGAIHREHTQIGFTFTFTHLQNFGEEVLTSSVRRLYHLTELFGLWRDITIRAGTNDLEAVDTIIRTRLRDRGWRELECLQAVWVFRQQFSEKKYDMALNLEWEHWSILAPDVLLAGEDEDGVESLMLDVMI
jgi:hypothetical protein